MTATKKPFIAIVGGGIGGLAAAVALHRIGTKVEIFEQASQLREVGAGLNIWPNAARLLLHLGFEKQLYDVAVRPVASEIRRWNTGDIITRIPLNNRGNDAPHYQIHRADLQMMLLNALPDNTVHLGHCCTQVVQHANVVELTFKNGTIVRADAVIGADGIHSVVQAAVVSQPLVVFSGFCAYRGLIPIERVPFLATELKGIMWFGPNRQFMCYPVSRGRLINFVAICPTKSWPDGVWSQEAQREDAIEEYTGWDEQVINILSSIQETKRWGFYDRPPLEKWSVGRISLLGDAAHPVLPCLAQGVNQAIEDAVVLANCLKQTTREALPSALRRYEALRKPRTTKVQIASRKALAIQNLSDGELQQKRDLMFSTNNRWNNHDWLADYDATHVGNWSKREENTYVY